MLRGVFGQKRDEVKGEWRKLHNDVLRDLYSLPSIVRVVKSRRMRLAGHVARMVEGRGVHRVLVGKPKRKRPLGRPRRKWENNIKVDLREVGGLETGWSWLRIETCEYGDEPSGSINCGEFLDYLQNQLASQEGLCSIE